MELEHLKTTWQSVIPQIEIQTSAIETNIKNKKDMKSKLQNQSSAAIIFLIVCLVLTATSRSWALLKLPVWWLTVFCMTIVFEIVCLLCVKRIIRGINIFEDTNYKILESVISIKKLYRNMELTIFIIIAPILIWLSFTPIFINSWRMIFVWLLTGLAFCGEYIYYRNYTKQLSRLSD